MAFDLRGVFVVLIIAALNAVMTRVLLRNLNYFLMERGIFGLDVNKPHKPKLPEEGGVSIVFSLLLSFVLFGFLFKYKWISLIIVTTFFIALIGFVDHFRNIRPYPKFVYCTIVGSLYSLYFLTDPSYSLEYSIAAIVVIGVSYSVLVNAFNVLAGFNGLEAGVTVISSATLTVYFATHEFYNAAAVAFFVAVSYAVFYQLNKYPAQIFIGNSGTLIPPSIFVGLAVFTHEWLPILFVTAPHLINVVIKYFSTGVSSRSDHKPLEYRDGLLHLPPGAYVSLIRLYLRNGPKHEKQLVRYVYSIELAFCILLFFVV